MTWCHVPETEWCHYRQRMRSELSAMPMAYGPWIWKPPIDRKEEPKQMDMFGGVDE